MSEERTMRANAMKRNICEESVGFGCPYVTVADRYVKLPNLSQFKDPVSNMYYEDPVMLSSGKTYCSKVLELNWNDKNGIMAPDTDPLSKEKVDSSLKIDWEMRKKMEMKMPWWTLVARKTEDSLVFNKKTQKMETVPVAKDKIY